MARGGMGEVRIDYQVEHAAGSILDDGWYIVAALWFRSNVVTGPFDSEQEAEAERDRCYGKPEGRSGD